MTKQEIVAVVLRVLAVFTGIRVLGELVLMISTDSGSYPVTWDGSAVVLALVKLSSESERQHGQPCR